MKYLLALLPLLLAVPAFGADFYYSTSGTDAATCPEVSPCQTLSAASADIDAASAGDNFYFNRGDTWNASACSGCGVGSLDIQAAIAGTSGNEITIGAYGTGAKPIIGSTTETSGNLFNARRPDYLIVEDIRFECSTTNAYGSRPNGINFVESFNSERSDNTIFRRIEVVNCDTGAEFQGTDTPGHEDLGLIQNLSIQNSLFKDNLSGNGIFLSFCQDCEIIDSEFDNNGEPGNLLGHNLYYGGNNDVGTAGNFYFARNEVHGGSSGIKIQKADGVIVEDNEIHDILNNTGTSPFASCFTAGGYENHDLDDMIFRRNTVYNCGTAGGQRDQGVYFKDQSNQTGTGGFDNLLVENNLIYDVDGVPLEFDNGNTGTVTVDLTNSTIQNNTLCSSWTVNDDHGDLRFGSGLDTVSGNVIRNNIFCGVGGYHVRVDTAGDMSGLDFQYNLFSGDASPDAVRVGATLDPTCADANTEHSPDFANCNDNATGTLFTNKAGDDYTLGSGSQAIDNGTTGATEDILQASRPAGSGTDMGAYEEGASATVGNMIGVPAFNGATFQ